MLRNSLCTLRLNPYRNLKKHLKPLFKFNFIDTSGCVTYVPGLTCKKSKRESETMLSYEKRILHGSHFNVYNGTYSSITVLTKYE